MATEKIAHIPSEGINPPPEKINIFIIDEDVEYVNALKETLKQEFAERIGIKTFLTGELAIKEIKEGKENPLVILLDYLSNRSMDVTSDTRIVDDIVKMCPESGVIILAEKQYEERAMKAIAYGAHDIVVKDSFADAHIITCVKKTLSPPVL